jgi:hypothetical protein
MSTRKVTCQTPGCSKAAVVRCESCDWAFCRQHVVTISGGVVAGSMGGSDQLHRYLGTEARATLWLCEECAAFTAPREAADGAHRHT